MKPHINFDFIRGILFSYAAYHLFTLGSAAVYGMHFPASLQTAGFGSWLFMIGIYLGLVIALVFTPKGFSRFVTLFLLIILIMQIGGAIFWSQHLPAGFPSPVNRALISQVTIGAVMVVLSAIYHFALRKKKAEQGAGANG